MFTFVHYVARPVGKAVVRIPLNAFLFCNCLQGRAIEIAAQHMVTDLPSSFGQSFMDLCGVGMAKKAAEK